MRRKKEVTMQYIADQLQISKVTVSKALKDQDGVSDELRQKIKDVARELGYKLPGSDQATITAKNIVIMVQEKYVDAKEYTTFYLRFYQKLASSLTQRGFMCNLFPLGDNTPSALELNKWFNDSNVGGVIVLGDVKKKHIEIIKDLQISMLFLDCYNADVSVDCIVTDNYYSTFEITNYLKKCGHSRIGFVGNVNATSSIQDRFLGYCRSLMGSGLPIKFESIIPDRDDSNEEIEFVLPREMPTAFVCNCDDTAYKFVKHLNEHGYRVPEDVSVVGFDNDIYAEISYPKLTTVAVNVEVMTEKATNLIIDKIQNGERDKLSRIFVTGDTVYRDSVSNIN
ncbi:LacI family DNA-binding transcriptional regulator [Niameybacter massiliensis]|uniref:LacI family DNA-binding transcriptional regulator n=1 Tax=Niameybacter massiliensis TaxID=1658108 RepID=UPI0006B41F7F|nr:LacI family DNA-binding transcriptional regulator [Niameybacter massiliensis]